MLARNVIRGFSLRSSSSRSLSTIKQATLNNGMKIVSRDGDAQTASMKFAVLGGSSAETEGQKGAAHFLSVAAFAGTENTSALKLFRGLEDIGATVGASADREKITLNVTCLSDHAEQAFIYMSDILSSSPRSTHAIQDLKPTVKLAYDEHASSPTQIVSELLHEAAFGEESPMGSSFFSSDLASLQLSDVQTYRTQNFVPRNMVIATEGLPFEEVQGWAEKYLSSTKEGAANTAVSTYTGGEAKQKANLGGSTYMAVAFPVPAGVQAKPYHVLEKVLAASSVHATAGLWGFHATGSSPAEANAQVVAGVNALKGVVSGAGDIEQIKRELTLAKTAALDSGDTAGVLLSASLAGVSPKDFTDYSKVSSADVVAAAKACLAGVPALATLGKTAGAMNHIQLSKILKE